MSTLPLPESLFHHGLTPEALASQYNNRALVPGFAGFFEDWAIRSAAVRASQPCELDLAYGPTQGQRLDVFLPQASPGVADGPRAGRGVPVVMFIHGGYWRSLDKHQHAFVAPLFTRLGACVVVVNYDLCPAVTIPDIVDQMASALQWVRAEAGRWGGDGQRVGVVGHSAGGHLAACLVQQQAKPTGQPGVQALAISGLYDLLPLCDVEFLAPDLRLTDADARRSSPARLPGPVAAQASLWSVAGADESPEFIRQNKLIQTAWGQHLVPVCETLPGLNHFSVLDALVQPGHPLHSLAQRWWALL
jgi:arylformamidase